MMAGTGFSRDIFLGGRFSKGGEGDIWRGKTGLEGQLGGAEKGD